MKITGSDVSSLVLVLGLGAQGYGLYDWAGLWCTCLVVGTEIAAMGLAGVWSHVR